MRDKLEIGNYQLHIFRCDYRDSCFVGCLDDGWAFQQQAFAGIHAKAGCSRLLHGRNSFHSDYGDIEAHVLVGLGYFYHGEGAGQWDRVIG